tara:strand:- start:11 stop:961 length:951 start_codon:yes stop_codon:yes gene_type:complete
MSKIKQIKTALIGAGIMGKYHARQLHEISDFSVVCDPDFSQVEPLINQYEIDYCSSFSEIPEFVDSVIIAAPTVFHEKIAIGLLRSGKNILIEKPLSGTYLSGQKILKESLKSSSTVAVGQIERFNPVIQKAKEKLSNGDWGFPVSISARRFSPFPKRISDVGVVFDIGIHDIDLIRYLFGEEVTQVSASGGSFNKIPFEDYASIILKFKDNKTGICETNWLSPVKIRKISMITSTHYVILDLLDKEIYQSTSSEIDRSGLSEMEKVTFDEKNALKCELINFLESTLSREEPLVTVSDGLESVRIAEEVIKEINLN